MSELLLPASVAIAAVALTYVFCIRPMRRGHCGMGSPAVHPRDLDSQLGQARAELETALAEQRVADTRTGDTAAPEPSRTTPPTVT
jgi:hypothetical protein